ncbi:MAG: fibrobacter succinogenes major paralogous domain-containing protein [Fibromonadaceae bacterium]|jgi:uncharacterized protein (TIGR02145 family)|nr:fibrobacter succinogenes major paralogous domain-containing protein [Fibromonadaceae bacterium]
MKKAASLLALLCIVACNQQKDTFTDTRDGKTYKTTKIGEQVWMAENLNYEVKGGSRCHNDSISYCDKYGRLYDWTRAMEACPKGWHLPSDAEWDKLYRYVDGDKGTESRYDDSKMAGKYLKATSGWNDYEGKSGNGENTYGFSALPGGSGYSGGSFNDNVGNEGIWWSASEYNGSYSYYRFMYYSNEGVLWSSFSKSFLFSVRCVQD